MHSWVLVTVVILLHAAAVGSLVAIQGCGSTSGAASAIESADLPPGGHTAGRNKAEPEPRQKEQRRESAAGRPPAQVQPASARPTGREPAAQTAAGPADKDAAAAVQPAKHALKPDAVAAGPDRNSAMSRPAKDAAQPAVAADPGTRAKAAADSGQVEYVVKSGDTLLRLANRFGATVAAIKSANNLKDDTLRIGQKLVIPAAPGTR